MAKQRSQLACRTLEIARGDQRAGAARAEHEQRAAQPSVVVAGRVRVHAAFLIAVALECAVFAGDLQLEQHPPPEPLDLELGDRWSETHDARPAIRAFAAEGDDLDRFAGDARIDALEQQPNLRHRIVGAEHGVDRRARERQAVQPRIHAREAHEHDRQHDERHEHRNAEHRTVMRRNPRDDVRPAAFRSDDGERAGVDEMTPPDARERTALA